MKAINPKRPPTRDALRRRIKEHYGTMHLFGYNIGQSGSFVSLVVNGWQNIDRHRAEKWADALGGRVGDLFPEFKD